MDQLEKVDIMAEGCCNDNNVTAPPRLKRKQTFADPCKTNKQAQPKRQKQYTVKTMTGGTIKNVHSSDDENRDENCNNAEDQNDLQIHEEKEPVDLPSATINNADTSFVCHVCGGTPCFWDELKFEVIEKLKILCDGDMEGNIKEIHAVLHKPAYLIYKYERHGFLGKGKRISSSTLCCCWDSSEMARS